MHILIMKIKKSTLQVHAGTEALEANFVDLVQRLPEDSKERENVLEVCLCFCVTLQIVKGAFFLYNYQCSIMRHPLFYVPCAVWARL